MTKALWLTVTSTVSAPPGAAPHQTQLYPCRTTGVPSWCVVPPPPRLCCAMRAGSGVLADGPPPHWAICRANRWGLWTDRHLQGAKGHGSEGRAMGTGWGGTALQHLPWNQGATGTPGHNWRPLGHAARPCVGDGRMLRGPAGQGTVTPMASGPAGALGAFLLPAPPPHPRQALLLLLFDRVTKGTRKAAGCK